LDTFIKIHHELHKSLPCGIDNLEFNSVKKLLYFEVHIQDSLDTCEVPIWPKISKKKKSSQKSIFFASTTAESESFYCQIEIKEGSPKVNWTQSRLFIMGIYRLDCDKIADKCGEVSCSMLSGVPSRFPY
jgi:hypothetical protein